MCMCKLRYISSFVIKYARSSDKKSDSAQEIGLDISFNLSQQGERNVKYHFQCEKRQITQKTLLNVFITISRIKFKLSTLDSL